MPSQRNSRPESSGTESVKVPPEGLLDAAELDPLTPYTPKGDGWKSLPVRLIYNQDGDLQVEIGPYTLGRRELRVLYRAINVWLQRKT
jgi:hypothetical protein